jgi:hypothetical protein
VAIDSTIDEPNHEAAIRQIIGDHFDEAERRLDDVYRLHFRNIGAIAKRHWRHKKDIPSDLMALPRHTWNLIATKVFRKRGKPLPRGGKARELDFIVSEQLLDLKGLEEKLQAYVEVYQLKFENEFTTLLEEIPGLRRQEFAKELEKKLEKLSTPIEGTRETIMFLIVGIVGRVYSDKVTFGSAAATGQAIATSLYVNQLSWFGSLWFGLFGSVPSWVTAAGAGGGILAGAIIAPLLAPILELGVNRARAKKVLKKTIDAARQKLTSEGPDAHDVAGKIAIYLQLLPDVVYLTRKISKV